MHAIFSYYRKALLILNRHIYIYLFTVFITILTTLTNYLIPLNDNPPPILNILNFLLTLLVLGYLFIPLILFNDAIDHKRTSIKKIVPLILRYFPRTLKVIVVATITFVALFGLVFFFSRRTNTLSLISFFTILFTLFNPIERYFGIYFMLGKKSLIESLKKSFQFTFRHLSFSYLPIPFLLIHTILTNYKIIHLDDMIILKLIYLTVFDYVSLLITGAYLLYFREKNHTHLSATA